MMRSCPNCGAETPAEKRFCGDCGAALPSAEQSAFSHTAASAGPDCPACGAQSPEGATVCAACGAPVQHVGGAPRRPLPELLRRRRVAIGASGAVAAVVVAAIALLLLLQGGDGGSRARSLLRLVQGPFWVLDLLQGGDGGRGPAGEVAIALSPFSGSLDVTLFTATTPKGTRIGFHGTREPDGSLKELRWVEVDTDKVHTVLNFYPTGKLRVRRLASVDRATGEDAALSFDYSRDAVTVDFYPSATSREPQESVTVPAKDVPGLSELLSELLSAALPGSDPDAPRAGQPLVADIGRIGVATGASNDSTMASAETLTLEVRTSVKTKKGQAVSLADDAFVTVDVEVPGGNLDCFRIRTEEELARPGQEKTATCRGLLKGGDTARSTLLERFILDRQQDGAVYTGVFSVLPPPPRVQVENMCSQADQWYRVVGTAWNVLDLVLAGAGGAFAPGDPWTKRLVAAGIFITLEQIREGYVSPGAKDCLFVGRYLEANLDVPWTVKSRVAFGPKISQCSGLKVGDTRWSAAFTFTGRHLISQGKVTAENTVVVPDPMEVVLTGPTRVQAGSDATYVATVTGGAGGTPNFSWLGNPPRTFRYTETSAQSTATYTTRGKAPGGMYPAAVTVRDANGCEIGKNIDFLVAGIATPAPTAKPSFQGTLVLDGSGVPLGFQVAGTQMTPIPGPTRSFVDGGRYDAALRSLGFREPCRYTFQRIEGAGTYDPSTGSVQGWWIVYLTPTRTVSDGGACSFTPVRAEFRGTIDSTGTGRGTVSSVSGSGEWTSTPQ